MLAEAATSASVTMTLTLDSNNPKVSDQTTTEKDWLPEWDTKEKWQLEIKRFFDRLRKTTFQPAPGDNPWKPRYLWVAEKGGTSDRPHAHVVLTSVPEWFQPQDHQKRLDRPSKGGTKTIFNTYWPFGGAMVDKTTPKAVRYCTDYLTDGAKSSKVISYGKSQMLGRKHLDKWLQAMCSPRPNASYAYWPTQFRWIPVDWGRLASVGGPTAATRPTSLLETSTQTLSPHRALMLDDWGCRIKKDDSGDPLAVRVPQLEMLEVHHKRYPLGRSEREYLKDYGFLEPPTQFGLDLHSDLDRIRGESTRSERQAAAKKIDTREQTRQMAQERQRPVTVEIDGVQCRIDNGRATQFQREQLTQQINQGKN